MMVLVNSHIPFLTLNELQGIFLQKGETKVKMISLSQGFKAVCNNVTAQ